MEHLSEMRLIELALDPVGVARDKEVAHLARCSGCAARLAEERRLSELIEAIPATGVPSCFTALAVERFERAARVRALRALGWAMVACLVVLVSTIVITLLAPESVVGSLAGRLAELTVLARAIYTVVDAAPAIGIGLVGAMLVATLAGCGLLAGLARRAAAVKYPGR